MLHFLNDYQEGAHPEVLKKLIDTNFEPLPGYGEDKYSQSAAPGSSGQDGFLLL